jgi:hypothetical protein
MRARAHTLTHTHNIHNHNTNNLRFGIKINKYFNLVLARRKSNIVCISIYFLFFMYNYI